MAATLEYRSMLACSSDLANPQYHPKVYLVHLTTVPMGCRMSDPFWLIVGIIAIATILLWPIRMWMLSRYDRDTDDEGETPLAPPERRNRG